MPYKPRTLDELDKLAGRRARQSLGLVDMAELAECRRLAERIAKDQLKLKAAILKASIAGAGTRQIADATGLSHMTVARIIRGEEGTPIRAPSEMAKVRRRRNRNSLSERAAVDEREEGNMGEQETRVTQEEHSVREEQSKPAQPVKSDEKNDETSKPAQPVRSDEKTAD